MATVKVPHDFPWPLKRLDVKKIGDKIGVDWSAIPLTEFEAGFKEELEHGSRDPQTDVTHNDPIATAKIALAHLKEDPRYYSKLERAMKMISAKAIQSRARKMVARKGIQSQIQSVIKVRQYVASLKSAAEAGKIIQQDQFLKLSSAISGLFGLGNLMAQAEGSAQGPGRSVWAGRNWENLVKEAAQLARYAASYSSKEKIDKYGEARMADAQAGWLKSLDNKLSTLQDDVKRNARNNAGTFRRQ